MPDVGCSAGDPANTVLPWSVGEALPELPHTLANSTPLAPYLSRRMRSCAILVDRHVHKNGGSTVRDVFLEHERLGFGLYHGYQQKRWQHDFRALRVAARQALRGGLAPSAHVLLVESHFAGGSSGGSELIDEVLPSLRELSSLYASRGVECPLVAMTRVREPLDYYLSFYRWGVGFRQRDNPAAYGTTFQEWVERVPDLQSSSMVYSLASYFAEYLPKNYRRKVEKAVGRNPRAAWRQLRVHLDAFDIVPPPPPLEPARLDRLRPSKARARITAGGDHGSVRREFIIGSRPRGLACRAVQAQPPRAEGRLPRHQRRRVPRHGSVQAAGAKAGAARSSDVR